MPAASIPVEIFMRGEGWYLVEFMDPAECGEPLHDQAAEYAALNPGTLRVEGMDGHVLLDLANREP